MKGDNRKERWRATTLWRSQPHLSPAKNSDFINISFENGMARFSITNASDHDANGMPRKYEHVTLNGSDTVIDGYLENIEKAYNYVGQKIASGEWEKHDCA